MDDLFLIVGLGNPGSDYARTRHNAGFMVLDRLAERCRASWRSERKFNARLARGAVGINRVVLCQPQTFMNASGSAVKSVLDYYQVELPRVLIVVDDADLPLGHLRMRPGGGSGGHHGLESVESHLGSKEYARLRVGIGRREGAREITGFVLGRFGSTESELVARVMDTACDQALCWVNEGIQRAMNGFNGVVEGAANEGKEQ
jgi:PTH1 family peptidyl-tRNA hydrolase